ncbi:hypothetical protein FRX31_023304 [Thalictrum thalictroides]|uniref:Uncharacterized protein n=1 Tax=Thalictrum thalictroides TaxID=46969 RepID=A0A7J6VPS5_THATH|nr:hypothetical protein FRX31_023304 [Thalictrum thalictroides]
MLDLQYQNPPSKPPILVYWTRPPDIWVALNTNGAACNELTAGGGIVRNCQGEVLANFFSFYGTTLTMKLKIWLSKMV